MHSTASPPPRDAFERLTGCIADMDGEFGGDEDKVMGAAMNAHANVHLQLDGTQRDILAVLSQILAEARRTSAAMSTATAAIHIIARASETLFRNAFPTEDDAQAVSNHARVLFPNHTFPSDSTSDDAATEIGHGLGTAGSEFMDLSEKVGDLPPFTSNSRVVEKGMDQGQEVG